MDQPAVEAEDIAKLGRAKPCSALRDRVKNRLGVGG
jgi:hypothetical protein